MWHLSKAGIVNVILVSLTGSWPRITGSTCRILIHFVEQIMLLDPKLNVQLLTSQLLLSWSSEGHPGRQECWFVE